MEKITRRCLRLRLRISILWKNNFNFPPSNTTSKRLMKGNIFLIENVQQNHLQHFPINFSTCSLVRHASFSFSITNIEEQMEKTSRNVISTDIFHYG